MTPEHFSSFLVAPCERGRWVLECYGYFREPKIEMNRQLANHCAVSRLRILVKDGNSYLCPSVHPLSFSTYDIKETTTALNEKK